MKRSAKTALRHRRGVIGRLAAALVLTAVLAHNGAAQTVIPPPANFQGGWPGHENSPIWNGHQHQPSLSEVLKRERERGLSPGINGDQSALEGALYDRLIGQSHADPSPR